MYIPLTGAIYYNYIASYFQSKNIAFTLQAGATFNCFNILNAKPHQASAEIMGISKPFQDTASFCYI